MGNHAPSNTTGPQYLPAKGEHIACGMWHLTSKTHKMWFMAEPAMRLTHHAWHMAPDVEEAAGVQCAAQGAPVASLLQPLV